MVARTITSSQVPYGSLYWVPEHRSSIVVDPMRLMLLVMVLFGAAAEIIALPHNVAMALSSVRIRRNVFSVQCSECQREEVQVSAGNRREFQRLS